MRTNYTNKKLIYPELSYAITGLMFGIHNLLGRFEKERTYSVAFERALRNKDLSFTKESRIGDDLAVYQPDFIIDNKIIVEIKAKQFVMKEDYAQILRYLRFTNKKLGLLVNFRNRFLKPKRIAN
ncbi:MAG: GxxExxY protein [Candidatus Sungbacteria bacterium]|nr:GxxExxY protein [Candidatus Sungbacteria bacterium]